MNLDELIHYPPGSFGRDEAMILIFSLNIFAIHYQKISKLQK